MSAESGITAIVCRLLPERCGNTGSREFLHLHLPLNHRTGQKSGNVRKNHDQGCANDHCSKERHDAFEYGIHGDIPGYTIDHKYIHTDRRGYKSHLSIDDIKYSEPDSIEAHGLDDREYDGKDYESERSDIKDASQKDKYYQDHNNDRYWG